MVGRSCHLRAPQSALPVHIDRVATGSVAYRAQHLAQFATAGIGGVVAECTVDCRSHLAQWSGPSAGLLSCRGTALTLMVSPLAWACWSRRQQQSVYHQVHQTVNTQLSTQVDLLNAALQLHACATPDCTLTI